ncbi:MAG: acyl carrier protein [Oscillospiraceae bacterium]|nr:acyl carrier protein [Oscillospiraceae bacterium]
MTINEKIALLEEALDLEEGTLKEDTLLEDVDEYDSMAKLSLIVMIDEEFGKKLDGSTVKGFKSVAEILKIME